MTEMTQADRLGVDAEEYAGDDKGAQMGDRWVTIHEALNWPAEDVPPDGRGVYARFLGLGNVWVVLERRHQ